MGGAFLCFDASMKPWLPWPEQVALLQERGLEIDPADRCPESLSVVNYYRFMGYARYFQVAPHQGDNRFLPGTRFADVWGLYKADEVLRNLLMPRLGSVEVALRTKYAYVVGRDVGPRSGYLNESFFAGARSSESLSDACRKDLDRSKERFILRYRDQLAADPYEELPVWSAVEAFSFGTLSKCIERGHHGAVFRAVADELGVAQAGFQSRVRALVYLRNRCAHHARLWRHSVVDAGATPNNIKHRAKRSTSGLAGEDASTVGPRVLRHCGPPVASGAGGLLFPVCRVAVRLPPPHRGEVLARHTGEVQAEDAPQHALEVGGALHNPLPPPSRVDPRQRHRLQQVDAVGVAPLDREHLDEHRLRRGRQLRMPCGRLRERARGDVEVHSDKRLGARIVVEPPPAEHGF